MAANRHFAGSAVKLRRERSLVKRNSILHPVYSFTDIKSALEAVNRIRRWATGIMAPRHFAFSATVIETVAEVRFPFISGAAQRSDSAAPK